MGEVQLGDLAFETSAVPEIVEAEVEEATRDAD